MGVPTPLRRFPTASSNGPREALLAEMTVSYALLHRSSTHCLSKHIFVLGCVCTNEKLKPNVCLDFISQCVFGFHVAGLGGTPAQMGFDAGNKVNFEAHVHSRTNRIIEIANRDFFYSIRSVHHLKCLLHFFCVAASR